MIAFTRAVPPTIGACELTHLDRRPIDVARCERQHRDYEQALVNAGCSVVHVAPAPDLPDSVFIEDTAIVTDRIAVICRPGAESRRSETEAVASALAAVRPIARIDPPGTVDGGDVLRVGRRLWVGDSGRTNADGIAQLRDLLPDYDVRAVPVHGCLHLKSAVTQVAERTLLMNPEWVDRSAFDGFEIIEVDEAYAANALFVNGTVIFPAAFPRTRDRLRAAGIEVVTVDVSEIAKAEGALTCCSILVRE